ncbi:MAG: hypothetical protein ACI9O6_000568 [Glaciecola sp.]|jgi:hypothetical protein
MKLLSSNELKMLHENRVANLDRKQIMPAHIEQLMIDLSVRNDIESRLVGHSFSDLPISCFSIGTGPIKVLMWSQMHGDESTATAAVLDILHLLSSEDTKPLLNDRLDTNWQNLITLHIVPMLNPDGAQAATRENAQCIDINRDALALQTPEGKILDSLVTELCPDYAFNLHDQHDYYRCGVDGKSSTLAFLAPAFDVDKTVNLSRRKAMALIALMKSQSNSLLPKGIARYNDEFSARSFGDQIAKREVSTILIESGHYPDDANREVARTMNVCVLIHALNMLCNQDNWNTDEKLEALEEKYWQIPENQEYKLCDILIKNVGFAEGSYTADIAIRKNSRFKNAFVVAEIGDLHEQFGLRTIDASGYIYNSGRPYLLDEKLHLNDESYLSLLKQGFSHFVGDPALLANQTDYITIDNPKFWHDDQRMLLGIVPAGFLIKDGKLKYAIIESDVIPL